MTFDTKQPPATIHYNNILVMKTNIFFMHSIFLKVRELKAKRGSGQSWAMMSNPAKYLSNDFTPTPREYRSFHSSLTASGLFWGFAFTPRLQKRRDACFFTVGCVISPFSQRDRFVAGLFNGRSGHGTDSRFRALGCTTDRWSVTQE